MKSCAIPLPNAGVWLGLGALLSAGTALAADPLSNLPFNLAGGAPNLDVRLRYEHVKLDEPLAAPITDDTAEAFTVRTRLGYTTGKWNDLDVQLEYEGLNVIGSEHYNSLANGQAEFPVVADARQNELNQAWLRYTGLPKTELKYGRQRIVLDNARFVGNVIWRQMEQTYDAALLSTTLVPRTKLTYAHLSNVNSFRFFDYDPSPALRLDDDVDIDAHLIHAHLSVVDKKLQVSAYAYLLDFETPPAPPTARLFQDTQTLGLRATGALPLGKATLSYVLEHAQQQDYADAPDTVDAGYTLVEAALAHGKLKATLGHEILEGDGTYSFQTPLATTHAHQGWADQFLITPLAGLQRTYLGASVTLGKTSFTAVYHQFEADEGGADYGSELDLLASHALIDNLLLSAKYAAYSADEYPVVAGTPVDTTKYWLFAEYKF